jgi:hypothetical protein
MDSVLANTVTALSSTLGMKTFDVYVLIGAIVLLLLYKVIKMA